MLQELRIEVKAAGKEDELHGNVRSALARGLPEFAECNTPAPGHDGTLVLAGSGPSIVDQIDEIRAHRKAVDTIWAIKGAHDLLCDNGITPEGYVNLDPRDRLNTVKRVNGSTEYLIASRCPPALFDYLEPYRVTLWHSYSPDVEDWPEFKGRNLVQGGTTSGMRAINLGHLRGFRRFVLYGFDSCLAADRLTKRFTGEMSDKIMDVIVAGRQFWCNAAMAQQAIDFKTYLQIFAGDAEFDVRGGGLLAAILDEFNRLRAEAA